MSNEINFDAKSLVQLQSPNAPFIAIFESDEDLSVFYAVLPSVSDPKIVDQVILDLPNDHHDVAIRWNSSGERSALLINERIICVFDFKKKTTFYNELGPSIETTWSRQTLSFSTELSVEFGIDQFFKQPHLDEAIEVLKSDESQTNRLLFYKALLTSKLFVPITTQSSDDPNALIYTFPNNMDDEQIDFQGNLICSFTNSEVFNDQMGQHGLAFQKIFADFLCFQAQSFDDILAITVTSQSGHTVLITRNEFKLLALISQPQRLDTSTLLAELGHVFFDDVLDDSREIVVDYYTQHLQGQSLVRSGYYCQPSVDSSKPLFCLVVNSTAASDALTALVQQLKQSDMQQFCDCHVFSLSDIVAQALEKSKKPLKQNH
tara:strand:- start:5786 stop:6913 length:1128 start_codon:yes stop_codon:yes gene_type:complete